MAAVTCIGLDIGSTAIRAVETGRGKDGRVITNVGQQSLPDGAVQGGVIQDGEAVTAALKRLWASAKFRGRKVVLGVSNPQVVVREMSVSNLPARELRRSLGFQVGAVLPLPVDRALLDFCPLEDPGDSETVRGLLIAAPKEAVVAAVEAVEQAGLQVTRVDLNSFALLRAVSRLDGEVEAIVDIGARATTVVVHADGEPLIVRTIPRGGAEITETIATRLRVPAEEAESVKRRLGLRGADEPATAAAVRDAVQPLIGEVRSSFAYLTAGERRAQVTRLVLSGGGSLLPGLADALRDQLDLDVVRADPTVRLHGAGDKRRDRLEEFRPSAAISIGLTLEAA